MRAAAAGGAGGADGSGGGSGGAHALQAGAPGSASAQKMSLNSLPNAEAPGPTRGAGKAQATQHDNFSDNDIIDAAWQGDLARVAKLLRRGAKANATGKGGWTPLYIAAQKGHTELARRLLANGANFNAPTEGGWTPLHIAAQKGQTEVARLLLANGANVNAPKQDGATPLHVAAEEGQTEVAGLLLANGANVNAPTEGGWTPLYVAAFKGHTEVARLLLANGANVNALNDQVHQYMTADFRAQLVAWVQGRLAFHECFFEVVLFGMMHKRSGSRLLWMMGGEAGLRMLVAQFLGVPLRGELGNLRGALAGLHAMT